MAVRKIIQIGHPSLKALNSKILDFKSKELINLITDLTDTLRKNELIGIAAPQIAQNYQVFITEIKSTKARKVVREDLLRVFINPKVTFYSKEKTVIYEGCGSVVLGKLFGPVERPKLIKIVAFDEKGKKFELKCDGILARVVQHEFDHLKGIEFTQKVSDYSKLMDFNYYKKYIRNSKKQLQASKITILEVST